MGNEFLENRMNLGSQVTVCGKEYAEIDNCRRIMEFSDICLRVKTGGGMIVEIWGNGLHLSDYSTGSIAVRGEISSIEFI
ncbi:MAG: YabP/YqfC family sporulation protein [Huintestinicola sp.]